MEGKPKLYTELDKELDRMLKWAQSASISARLHRPSRHMRRSSFNPTRQTITITIEFELVYIFHVEIYGFFRSGRVVKMAIWDLISVAREPRSI